MAHHSSLKCAARPRRDWMKRRGTCSLRPALQSSATGAAASFRLCRNGARRRPSTQCSAARWFAQAESMAMHPGSFAPARLVWMSEANAGHAQDVRDHRATGDGATLALWSAPPSPVAVGDAFAVTAGCDKRFSTCRDRS